MFATDSKLLWNSVRNVGYLITVLKLSGLDGIRTHITAIKIIMAKYQRQSRRRSRYTVHSMTNSWGKRASSYFAFKSQTTLLCQLPWRYSNCYYNIPRACLLNRSPVPAMDLKSNRSSLWRHMLETCRRLKRLCRKHLNNVARNEKTPVKSALLSRDKNILSRDMSSMFHKSDIMLGLLYI